MRTRARLAALVLLLVLSCGGDRFTAAGSGGGGQAGSPAAGSAGIAGGGSAGAAAGASAGGSAGASAGSGGTAGDAAGAGGAGAPGCVCGSGQYCRSGMCRDCSDISSIELSDPVEILDHPDSGLRFPRGFAQGNGLFFTLLAAGGGELWYTGDPQAEPSFRLGDAGTPARSGLLPLEHGVAPVDVVFDEVMDGRRTARSAVFDGATLTNVSALGSPLSPGGFDTYSLAVALETNRYYWMSNRDGPVELRTGVLGTGNEDVVVLEVPSRSGAAACPREGDDATPWVSSSGELMVFSAAPMDDQCTTIDAGASDLYIALLSPSSGMPLAPAIALTAVNRTLDASVQTDPSFTPDLCRLYFASDGGQAGGHDFRLFRADRR